MIRWVPNLTDTITESGEFEEDGDLHYGILLSERFRPVMGRTDYLIGRAIFLARDFLHELIEIRFRQEVRADWEQGTVAEEFLDRADVGARFEQVGREAVAKYVAGDATADFGAAARFGDGALQARAVGVVASSHSGARVP